MTAPRWIRTYYAASLLGMSDSTLRKIATEVGGACFRHVNGRLRWREDVIRAAALGKPRKVERLRELMIAALEEIERADR